MAKYQYTVQGVDYDVEIAEIEGTLAKVTVNGVKFDVEMKQPISVGKTLAPKPVAPKPVAAKVQGTAPAPAPKPAPVKAGEGTAVASPLPGTITAINVKVGDAVAVGDVVIVLEAMKMQNNIEAETAGTVTAIMANVGEAVPEGAPLLTIA